MCDLGLRKSPYLYWEKSRDLQEEEDKERRLIMALLELKGDRGR